MIRQASFNLCESLIRVGLRPQPLASSRLFFWQRGSPLVHKPICKHNKRARSVWSAGNFNVPESQEFEEPDVSHEVCDGVKSEDLQPGLYLVATPIGNLEDITLRALRVLRNATAILAEDTRHSRKLLRYHAIEARTFSFHEHNEREKEEKVLDMLKAGQAIALISDAGIPLISDPGSSLVSRVAQSGIRIFPIPGPSAVLSALVASGLPTNQFQFCGFLPPKQVARHKAITALIDTAASLVFFVPPHSLVHVLSDLGAILGSSRRCAVARELTKVYEEFYRASLGDALTEFSARVPKGEITLVVEGAQKSQADALSDVQIETELQALLDKGFSASSAARQLSQDLGLPKNRIYNLAIQLVKETKQKF